MRRTPVVLGNARFTVFSEGLVRLEWAHGGRFADGPSLIAGDRLPRPAAAGAAEVRRRGRALEIRTPRLTLLFEEDGKPFHAGNLKIDHRNAWDEPRIWTPGMRDAGNLGAVVRSLDVWRHCGGPERHPVEGILSTDGAHLLEDTARVYRSARHARPECRAGDVVFDGWFFAYGNDYKAALRDLVRAFGPIPLLPRWALGFWYSRWWAYRDREFVALAKRYRRAGVPIDVMVIDTDWRKGWGGYDWNKKFFPNPRRTLRDLHRMNLRIGLNDHPGYDGYEPLPAGDSCIPRIEKRLGALPHQGQWACDWSNPRALEVWRDGVLGPLFDDGIDFWWVDGWIKPPFGACDSQGWANRQYFELAEERTGKRGLILSRWGGPGSHRYPVQFSGDTHSTWETLRHQIEFTARSCGLGAAWWSHDIGGFHEKRIDEEIFIRWLQFGALSPVFRTHSAHGFREPWRFSRRAREIFRRYARIRAALAPYLYGLAREAHESGLPPCRPLFLEHPERDGGALHRRHQYLLGRDLLVVPADAPVDAATGVLEKRAYFPPGGWFGLETSEEIRGVEDRPVPIPLDRIPVYVRAGAILPCRPAGEAVGVGPDPEIHVEYWPDPDAPSLHHLYEDDGESREHLRGGFARTSIRARRRGGRIEVEIDAPRGRYRGMPRRRRWIVRVHLAPGERIVRTEVRPGRGPRRAARARPTDRCLAGEARSGHRFAEVAVDAAGSVAVRIDVA